VIVVEHDSRWPMSLVYVACDRCKAKAPSSRRWSDGVGEWDKRMALAAAPGDGFVPWLDGRVSRLLCPACASPKPQATHAEAGPLFASVPA